MSTQRSVSPTLIGGFVLGALLLGLATVFLLSEGGFTRNATKFILYFESDIKGLQVGAPVNFRGVKIGQVESMSIEYDSQTRQFTIPVIISIESRKVGFDGKQKQSHGLFDVEQLIREGLRARLNLQSLVTGKLEVELDFEPDSPVRLIGGSDEYPEIPTVQSNLDKIADAIEELPLKRITRRVSEILESIDKALADGKLEKTVEKFILLSERLDSISRQLESATPSLLAGSQATLDETRALLRELDATAKQTRQLIQHTGEKLDGAFESWNTTMASGEASLDQVKQAASSADGMLRDDSSLVRELNTTLREMGAAARSIRIMSEYLERHPEALLRGKQ
jgi:paraquat-inducible protein B